MRILVTGGRDFHYKDVVYGALNKVHRKRGISLIIQGGASGADHLASDWAKDNAIDTAQYNADWCQYGKAAGPIRNQRMIDEGKPNAAVAFPGGSGTADMVRRLNEAGVPVWKVKP